GQMVRRKAEGQQRRDDDRELGHALSRADRHLRRQDDVGVGGQEVGVLLDRAGWNDHQCILIAKLANLGSRQVFPKKASHQSYFLKKKGCPAGKLRAGPIPYMSPASLDGLAATAITRPDSPMMWR